MGEPKTDRTEMKRLTSCHHHDCRVHYDCLDCPLCAAQLDLANYSLTTGRLRRRNTDLEKQVAELEDQLSEEDLDDPPIKEPQRPEDMGARRGTEVTARTWEDGKEAGS